MPWRSLGRVQPSSGTAIRITNGQLAPTARLACHAILIQADPDNTGKVFIGDSNLVVSTKTGVKAVLAIPTANSIPSANAGIPDVPNGMDASTVYVDTTINGDGAYISILEA